MLHSGVFRGELQSPRVRETRQHCHRASEFEREVPVRARGLSQSERSGRLERSAIPRRIERAAVPDLDDVSARQSAFCARARGKEIGERVREVNDAVLSANLLDDLLERQPGRDLSREVKPNHVRATSARDLLPNDDTIRIEVARPQRSIDRMVIGDRNAIDLKRSRAVDELARRLIRVVRVTSMAVEVSADDE